MPTPYGAMLLRQIVWNLQQICHPMCASVQTVGFYMVRMTHRDVCEIHNFPGNQPIANNLWHNQFRFPTQRVQTFPCILRTLFSNEWIGYSM